MSAGGDFDRLERSLSRCLSRLVFASGAYVPAGMHLSNRISDREIVLGDERVCGMTCIASSPWIASLRLGSFQRVLDEKARSATGR